MENNITITKQILTETIANLKMYRYTIEREVEDVEADIKFYSNGKSKKELEFDLDYLPKVECLKLLQDKIKSIDKNIEDLMNCV